MDSFKKVLASQTEIGWKHFIRGRISIAFKSQLVHYFNTNKLGKRYYVQSWYSKVISGLWSIHLTEWRNFSSTIHGVDNKDKDKATIKTTLLSIVRKYYIASQSLPKYKKIWVRWDITRYNKFSIEQQRRLIGTARDILKRFQLNQRKKATHRQTEKNKLKNTSLKIRPPLTKSHTQYHSICNKAIAWKNTNKQKEHSTICTTKLPDPDKSNMQSNVKIRDSH